MSTAPSPAPPQPLDDASPSTVRDYLIHILTTHHSAPVDSAHAVASKWRFGRGSELRSFPLSTYMEIFGAEAGTILHAHCRADWAAAGKGRISDRGA